MAKKIGKRADARQHGLFARQEKLHEIEELEKRRQELNLQINKLMEERMRCDVELNHACVRLETLKTDIRRQKA